VPHLIGAFDPVRAMSAGFQPSSFCPGPLVKAMLTGGIFLANELNRTSEYAQNSLLEPLEEKSVLIPNIDERVHAQDGFFFMASANPAEITGTHRLSEALRDRLNVWITLTYPDSATELKIIRSNTAGFDLDEDILDKVRQLITRTRTHTDVIVPASIRAGISIVKLTSTSAKREKKQPNEVLPHAAEFCLTGAVKARPGVKPNLLVKGIIKEVLGY
jgi:MoxR-like ATPase